MGMMVILGGGTGIFGTKGYRYKVLGVLALIAYTDRSWVGVDLDAGTRPAGLGITARALIPAHIYCKK